MNTEYMTVYPYIAVDHRHPLDTHPNNNRAIGNYVL
jgi:hypothetical protein